MTTPIDTAPVVHWTAFDDGEPACGSPLPPPPSRKKGPRPEHGHRVTIRTGETTCLECKRFVRLILSEVKTAIEDVS